MPVRSVVFEAVDPLCDTAMIDQLASRYVLGLVASGTTDHFPTDRGRGFAFRLNADDIGIRMPDPRLFSMAAAAAG